MTDTPHVAFTARFPPAVGDVIITTSHRIERGRITGCAHLETEPIGIVCWRHPTTVRCHACAQEHVSAHSRHDEHDCDICGEFMPDATTVLMSLVQPVEVDALVPIGRGRFAAVGKVVFIGWGACVECMTELQA